MLKISGINCLEIVRGMVTRKPVTFVFCFSSKQGKAEVHTEGYSDPGDVKRRGRLLPNPKIHSLMEHPSCLIPQSLGGGGGGLAILDHLVRFTLM